MKMFQVRIGRYTRRGNFDGLANRAVQTGDEISESKVREYFTKQYQGLDVKVTQAITVEDLTEKISEPAIPVKEEADRSICYIPDVPVMLNEAEKELFNDMNKARRTYEGNKDSLIRSIKERFRRFPYVKETIRNEFEFYLDSFEVTIKKLPIKAVGIYRAALENKSGMEAAEEQEGRPF